MKALLIALGVAVVVTMAGCSDGDGNVSLPGNGNNGNNGGGGTADNLQTFVVNNCGTVTNGDAFDISGQMFPPDSSTDPEVGS